MTNSDDLVRRLEEEARAHDRKTGWPEMTKIEAANRIRELEAELAEYTNTFSPYDVLGVREGSDVIVPVEPTEAMMAAGGELLGHSGKWSEAANHIYRAMIEAAQEQDND
jgi:hypothetical protein